MINDKLIMRGRLYDDGVFDSIEGIQYSIVFGTMRYDEEGRINSTKK